MNSEDNSSPFLRGSFLTHSIQYDYDGEINTISSPLVPSNSPILVSEQNKEKSEIPNIIVEKNYFDSSSIQKYLDDFDKNLVSKLDIFFEDTYLENDVEEYLIEKNGEELLSSPFYKKELYKKYAEPENIVNHLSKELDINFDEHLLNQAKIKEYASKKAIEMEAIKTQLDKLIEQYNNWKRTIKNFLQFVEHNNNCDENEPNSASSKLKDSLEVYQKEVLKKMEFEAVLSSYAKVHAELSGIKMFIVKYTNSTEEYICPVCKTAKVKNVLVPCGHTYCETCIRHIENRITGYNICPMCRKAFQFAQKIYFS